MQFDSLQLQGVFVWSFVFSLSYTIYESSCTQSEGEDIATVLWEQRVFVQSLLLIRTWPGLYYQLHNDLQSAAEWPNNRGRERHCFQPASLNISPTLSPPYPLEWAVFSGGSYSPAETAYFLLNQRGTERGRERGKERENDMDFLQFVFPPCNSLLDGRSRHENRMTEINLKGSRGLLPLLPGWIKNRIGASGGDKGMWFSYHCLLRQTKTMSHLCVLRNHFVFSLQTWHSIKVPKRKIKKLHLRKCNQM